MKKLRSLCIYTTLVIVSTLSHVFAARMYIVAPDTASSNREQVIVSVYVDPEGDSISGIAGDLSFPSEVFEVKSITMQSGFVSMWMTSPHVSLTKSFDSRTHIEFDGIVPGGFRGVRSPYYQGEGRGVVFTLIVTPTHEGDAPFTLSDVEIRSYDSDATLLSSAGDEKYILVPQLTGKPVSTGNEPTITNADDISVTVSTSELINSNSKYIYVHNANPNRSIDHIEVAESLEYNPAYVSSREWHTVTNPYTLINQSQTRYVHVKVVYADNTFAYKTVAPVENSTHIVELSRILVYIVIAISLLYHYAKHFLYFSSKKYRTKK